MISLKRGIPKRRRLQFYLMWFAVCGRERQTERENEGERGGGDRERERAQPWHQQIALLCLCGPDFIRPTSAFSLWWHHSCRYRPVFVSAPEWVWTCRKHPEVIEKHDFVMISQDVSCAEPRLANTPESIAQREDVDVRRLPMKAHLCCSVFPTLGLVAWQCQLSVQVFLFLWVRQAQWQCLLIILNIIYLVMVSTASSNCCFQSPQSTLENTSRVPWLCFTSTHNPVLLPCFQINIHRPNTTKLFCLT